MRRRWSGCGKALDDDECTPSTWSNTCTALPGHRNLGILPPNAASCWENASNRATPYSPSPFLAAPYPVTDALASRRPSPSRTRCWVACSPQVPESSPY